MSSAAAPDRRTGPGPGLYLPHLFLTVLLLVSAGGARASTELPPPEGPEAWLLTYGPGEIYWQRFGHNAIWLREPGGLDHAFNFGFFDFEQESFLLRFVQGRMLYFAAAVPAQREMAFYGQEGREIRAQRLDLGPEAYARLREHLVWHVQPENREYLYDYYLDNCSTRLRDALDLALGGALDTRFGNLPGSQNLRDHTRRSTERDTAYHLGLVAALGLPVDRPISRWDEMFLPALLAEGMAELTVTVGGEERPVVVEDRILSLGRITPPPATPGRTWPRYALLGGLLAVLGLLAARFGRPAAVDGLAYGWLLITGTLGLGMALVWGFTDHRAAYPNLNLLLFSPLWLLGVASALRRLTAALMALGCALALGVALWPSGQYLADTLALVLPVNLLVAWRLWSAGRSR